MNNNGKVLMLLMVLYAFPAHLWAERSGDQGYGLMVGNPTGLSAKVWLNEEWGLDGAVGIARGEFDVHMTLLFHQFTWHQKWENKEAWIGRLVSKGSFPFYVGVGPRLLFEDDEEWGIRFPLGLSFLPFESNWEVFGEFAPVIRLTPDTGFNGDFALGVRYYFQTIRPRIGQSP